RPWALGGGGGEEVVIAPDRPRPPGVTRAGEPGCGETPPRRDRRRHSDRVAVVGAGVLAVAGRHQAVHDFLFPAEDAQRKAAADRLAQRTQVRRDAEVLLCAARTRPEGAENLVEHEHNAVLTTAAQQDVKKL